METKPLIRRDAIGALARGAGGEQGAGGGLLRASAVLEIKAQAGFVAYPTRN
jgi:hypothetical protein